MTMECAETRERIELAAAEPAGLERLMAGDTADAAAVAGHLAACAACVDELARVRRAATVIREAVASVVDPSLRARTLDYVRALGRERPAAAPVAPAAPAPPPASTAPVATPVPDPALRRGRRTAAAWLAGVAASAVVAAGLTAALVLPGRDAAIARQSEEIAFLARVSAWTVRVESRPDATRVRLAGTGDDAGTLLYSPSSGELVVVAAGLESPPPDKEYGCWVESRGAQRWIGRMRFGGEVAGWAGPVQGLEELDADAVFRVSLDGQRTDDPAGDAPSEPRLWGAPSD